MCEKVCMVDVKELLANGQYTLCFFEFLWHIDPHFTWLPSRQNSFTSHTFLTYWKMSVTNKRQFWAVGKIIQRNVIQENLFTSI